MMEGMKRWCVWMAALVVCLLAGYHVGRKDGARLTEASVRMESRVVVDTVPFYVPMAMDSVVIRYKTVKLPSADGSSGLRAKGNREPDVLPLDPDTARDVAPLDPDTARVVVPIESKMYRESNYTAWVSGYEANLDSIEVYPRTVYVTRSEVYRKPNRWGLTLSAGYGYTPGEGMKPFVGLGISYTIKPLKWK